MSENKDLQLVGRSEDGQKLELIDDEGVQYSLRVGHNLRTLINQPRLVSVAPIDDRSSVTVKEIQSRLRSGESAESIERSTEWSLEKIDRFSGPIMQERAYIIGLALEIAVSRETHSPLLADATIAQLVPRGVDMTLVDWNTYRNEDGTWNIVLKYPSKVGMSEANWTFDVTNRNLGSVDDGAHWISGEERPTRPSTPTHGLVYSSDKPAPRLVAVKEDTDVVGRPDLSEIPTDAKRDGVTKRIRIPSWDDIMFGSKKDETPDS